MTNKGERGEMRVKVLALLQSTYLQVFIGIIHSFFIINVEFAKKTYCKVYH